MASKKVPEINGGSMADISFLMLIFFLMVSTMDPETGLSRRLPPMPADQNQLQDMKVNRRNLMEVKINSRNGVMAGGQVILTTEQLEEITVEFLTNPADRADLPSKKLEYIEGLGEYPVSEGVISLQNDRQSSYAKYVEIQNVLVRAINKVRDEFSLSQYGDKYDELTAEQQEIVRKAIPNRLSEAEPVDVTKR